MFIPLDHVALPLISQQPILNHVIIPSGYRGPIAVVSHATFSATVTFEATPDRNVLTVPPTAVVCAPSSRIFDGYRLTAEYTDGSLIHGHVIPPESRDAIRVFGIGSWGSDTEGETVHWLAVGTEEEFETIERAFFSGKIQEMMPAGVTLDRREDFERFGRYCRS